METKVFKIDRSRVMKKAWEMKRNKRTCYLYRTFADALREAWGEEKRSVARMNDFYKRAHGTGRYATPPPPMEYKPVALTEIYGPGVADSLVRYYSRSGKYVGD